MAYDLDSNVARYLPGGQTSKRLVSSYVLDWVTIVFVRLLPSKFPMMC